MSGRMVRLSKRAERQLFAGYLPIDLAINPAMAARRKARRARKHSGYCLPGQRRAYRARNVLGRMIWANKPLRFGGLRWLEGRACMASFVEFLRRCERARAALCQWDGEKYVKVFSPRRAVHLREIDANVERMRCPWFGVPESGMDAPDWMFSGGYVSIDENHSLGVPGVVMRAGS